MRDKGVVCVFPALFVLSCLTNCVVAFNVDTDSPLVFKGPLSSNSYFGYSVAILENSQGTWLLVGAPRWRDASQPDVQEPGAVFQCNWQYRSSCQPVFIDDVGNERQTFYKWKNITVQHSKDNQWLGASIDVNVHGDSQVMICAPRWVDHQFYVQGMQLMNGLCYESSRDLHFDESSAWPVLEYWKKQVHATGFYTYGMGSLGLSAVYSSDGSFAVLGAPGLNDWAGGFAHVEPTTNNKPRILELPVETENSSYFGMSVTTAKLSAEGIITIVGGPRAGGYGKIYAYNNNFQLLFAKEGDQIGSSFGSSICAVDLNGDNLDDLVVGAPMYADILDEGRVYVYINKEFFNLELMEPLLSGSNTPRARFGTSVANLGDLNLDHYEDIAVGAPYEEESGVVYIYNGAKFGLHTEPSQRIVGKSLNKDLKAFGWSFSRPWDVDGNHYGDFAVGAFESNKVVLLRTRSVVDLFASLEITPPLIDMSDQPMCSYRGQRWHCIEAAVCLRYTGQNLPPSSEVNITLQLDTLERHRGERSRLFIQGAGYTEIETINELVTLRLDRVVCARKYTVFVRKSRDVVTPLQMELEYDIASNSIGIASMCTICPIRNKYNPTTVHEKVHFALDCGSDHVCKPDLDIKTAAVFNNNNANFMIDDSPFFDLEVTVSNSGEISYLTTVTIEYPSTLHYTTVSVLEGRTSVTCIPVTGSANLSVAILSCDVEVPVKTDDKIVYTVRFYAHGVPYDVCKIEIRTRVESAGQITSASRKKETLLSISVEMRTEMRLAGVSIPGQLPLPREQYGANDKDEWSPLSHLYILRNLGPSPMPHGQLILSVPAPGWIKLIDVQIDTKANANAFSHVPVECNVSNVSSDGSEAYYASHLDYNGYEDSTDKDSLISYMTCNSSECSTVICYVGLLHKYETVYINVSLSVRTDVLRVLKINDQLALVSSGVLKEPDYLSYSSLTPTYNVTTTTYILYQSLPRQAITWWVLVISISSGLLLLYIVAVIMWKCGFFRRKQREELQRLIRSSEAEREILTSDSLSAGSGDIMILPPGHGITGNHNHLDHNEGLFYYPHLEPDHSETDHNFNRQDFFHNHSLNRRDVNHGFSQFPSFHTLQYNHRSSPQRNGDMHNISYRPSNYHRQSRNSNPRDTNHSHSPQPNIWIAPPAAPTPPPSFNNEMYLEPLESRA